MKRIIPKNSDNKHNSSSDNTRIGESMNMKNTSNTSNTVKRLSISLTNDAAELLKYIAESQGITQNEALRKAIATEAYLLQERKQGSKVLLQKSDNEIREVLFR